MSDRRETSDFVCPECKDTGEYRGLNTVEPCRACGGRTEIPFPIRSVNQISMDANWQFGKSTRHKDGLDMEIIVSTFVCSLSNIHQERSRYADYKKLIQGQDTFTAVFQCGENETQVENVTMVACQHSLDGRTADFILEWEPDDA